MAISFSALLRLQIGSRLKRGSAMCCLKQLNVVLAAVIGILTIGNVFAQQITATTSDGKLIIVNPDGTWKPIETAPLLVKGKINLSVGLLEYKSGYCIVGFRLENMTDLFFEDYSPEVTLFDKNGNHLGGALWMSQGQNFRPNGIATFEAWAANTPCKDIAQATVPGFRYCKFRGKNDLAACESALNLVPSTKLPLVRR
jgi:hypothetical protein